MNNRFFVLVLAVISLPVFAAGKVNYLDINQGIVMFSTDESKTVTSPSCVITANSSKWALSLNSENGRAIYSMLMTAMAIDMPIGVETAADCDGAEGYERPGRVWFESSIDATPKPSTLVETITTYKTVAYAFNRGGYCAIEATLTTPNGRSYMRSSNRANGRDCYCLEGSKMIKAAGTGTEWRVDGTSNNNYVSYLQCVIEVEIPLIKPSSN